MKNIAIINPDASDEIKRSLRDHDIEPLAIPSTPLVDKPISGHPDLQLFIHEEKAFCHPDICTDFIKSIKNFCEIIICRGRLSREYPGDIAYNIACTGKIALHKTDNTNKTIKQYLRSQSIDLININQGYSKCSTMIIDEKHIITADNSIHRAASENDMNSLLINPGYIDLPGYKYGFIGGASAAYEDWILLTGSLDHHPDRDRIFEHMEKAGKKPVFLSKEKIIDLGSIFII